MGIFDTAADNYIKGNTNTDGIVAQTIDNEIMNNKPKLNGLGSLFSNLGNGSFSYQQPDVSFNPAMTQPQFLKSDFQNQQSNMGNLFNYLVR